MTKENDKFSCVTDARYIALLIPSIKMLTGLAGTGALGYIENERFFGVAIAPHPEGGILLCAQTRFSCVMAHDPKGSITEPANVTFPKAFLKACKRKKFHTMVTENQDTYEAEDTVPAFIQPGLVHVFYCGAYVAGKEAPTEDNEGSVLYSTRACMDDRNDPWAVHIKPRELKLAEQWQVMATAPTQKENSIVVSEALGLLSDTMQAHSREFYDDPLPIWSLEEIKTKHAAGAYRAQCKGGVEIIACIAQANPAALEGGGNG